jgi:hypothetical protein
MRELSKAQSRKRVAELRRQGCKVKTVQTRDGTFMLKQCPGDLSGIEPQVPTWFAAAAALGAAVAAFKISRLATSNV